MPKYINVLRNPPKVSRPVNVGGGTARSSEHDGDVDRGAEAGAGVSRTEADLGGTTVSGSGSVRGRVGGTERDHSVRDGSFDPRYEYNVVERLEDGSVVYGRDVPEDEGTTEGSSPNGSDLGMAGNQSSGMDSTPILDATGLPAKGGILLPPEQRSRRRNRQKPVSSRSNPENIPPFIGKLTPTVLLPATTKAWIRNGTDERAAQEGMRFSRKRAEFAINWMEKNCYIYEGDYAGDPIWFMDWQYDFMMRLYGWQQFDTTLWYRWIRRFKQSCLWAPKKSGKSPFEAANGLYICFGEGVPGNKCYSTAFDKAQALIAHTHAVHMVEFSPTLSRQCKINQSTKTIFHHKSLSEYRVISGDKHDRKGASKEGFNGSVFVDETHAVTFELMRRLKRAGIGRPEALKFECSTAGPDLQGYGYGRYILGEKISKSSGRGDTENPYIPGILHVAYMPPAETTIEDYRDESKVRELIKLTNPSLGYLLSEQEAIDDWKESIQTSEEELRSYAMYRTNLWLTSATSWIPMHTWNAAKRHYGLTPLEQLQALKGYPCFGGLDLSKVSDMSSLAVGFLIPLSEDEALSQQINMMSMQALDEKRSRLGNDRDISTFSPLALQALLPPDEDGTRQGLAAPEIEVGKNGMAADGLTLWYKGRRYIIRFVHFFWIPRSSAIRIQSFVNLFEWEHLIDFCKTDVINYKSVSDHIEWLKQEFGMKHLGYDPAYSLDVIKNLIAGTWYERDFLTVDQKLATMSPLSQDWERGIISQSVQHPGNAVLDWMNSHCELYRGPTGLVKPVKPEFGDFRKIDGIIAGINALGCLRGFGIDTIIDGKTFSSVTTASQAVRKAQGKLAEGTSGEGWTEADLLGE